MSRSNLSTSAAFLTRLAEEGRRQRALRRPLLLLLACYVTLPALPLLHAPPPVFACLAALLFLVTSGLAIYLRKSALRLRRIALELLPQRDEIQAVGPLLEVLDMPDAVTRHAIIAALLRLLPRLKEEDGKQLSDYQRECLYRALEPPNLPGLSLNSTFHEPLAVAILKALEKIGDEKAIPLVEKASLYSEVKSVRRAAQNCLLVLNTRCIASLRIQVGRTLLRPVLMDQAALELPRTAPPPTASRPPG